MSLTQEFLKSVLTYDPFTGIFVWVGKPNGRVEAQAIAGSLHSSGYIHIGIQRRVYKAHRLAWLYMTGEFPSSMLDHKNGDRSDNRWANIRQADSTKNCMNRACRSDSRTGMKGVRYDGRDGRFQAVIMISGKSFSLGRFASAEDAHAAYMKAANDNFGEFRVQPFRARSGKKTTPAV
ncbi:hypothetical protein 2A_00071 [Ralstonia phage Darius]|uniref:HNH nuclease domain-containing protein n=4 Tax=Caudoviricetes TaxID=2731619 RepID=A0A7G5BAS1_9CAUD|nr:hypothetical protein KMC44_gp58 [Ralstonia phage Cimandef]YP_010078501.1 hypothetical protein KMC48_gp59 [Ralstonia phage Heva]YP_010078713.1 hypothetical protein KMC51_gp66 [Ralstonia phage Gervaise]QMV32823.1 hypothetical protein 2A_00071 [Ralstonia phage Darius]QMV32657.1 hypothetical protein B2_00023 [Ralstonia phage Cimandef]QMV33291.1 hypothetical protein 1Ca_00054 [Ralstonia phage Gervaise]QMV33394.1 hypothetical protein F1_00031 [Ralstonia phage Heva]